MPVIVQRLLLTFVEHFYTRPINWFNRIKLKFIGMAGRRHKCRLFQNNSIWSHISQEELFIIFSPFEKVAVNCLHPIHMKRNWRESM